MADAVESIGLGTTVWINDGASQAYVQVFNVVSVTPPAPKTNMVESKRLNSTNGAIRQVPTMSDVGELSIKQQMTNAGYARVELLRTNKTLSNVKIVVTDDMTGTTMISPGYVTQNKTDSIEPDKITEYETTFSLNDAPTT